MIERCDTKQYDTKLRISKSLFNLQIAGKNYPKMNITILS